MKNKGCHRHSIFPLSAAVIFIAVVASACGAGNYGSVRLSREVEKLFESYQVLDHYNYFYSGSDAIPDAIIGIHEDYVLQSQLWKPVDLTREQLQEWIFLMTDHHVYSAMTYGAELLDSEGKTIGIWYSPYDQTVVKMVDDRKVVVHTPVGEPFERKKGMFLFMND